MYIMTILCSHDKLCCDIRTKKKRTYICVCLCYIDYMRKRVLKKKKRKKGRKKKKRNEKVTKKKKVAFSPNKID